MTQTYCSHVVGEGFGGVFGLPTSVGGLGNTPSWGQSLTHDPGVVTTLTETQVVSIAVGAAATVLLGSYPAKQCPQRTHNDFSPAVPDPDELPRDVLRRMADGRVFEQEISGLMKAALGQDCVSVVYGDHRADKVRRIVETLAAMEAGAAVIIGGQLPDDHAGGRTGSPDVLFRATGEGEAPKYLPADIKHHSTLKKGPRGTVLVSRLSDAYARTSVSGWSHMTSHRVADSMQLAHYTWMLKATGFHPGPQAPYGAILGTSDFTPLTGDRYGFVWYDLSVLTEKTWSDTGAVKRSVLDCYGTEFAHRVAVAQSARVGGAPLVRPFGKAECTECPYKDWCRTQAGPLDASFAITTGQVTDREWTYLHEQGLGTIAALAGADADGPLASGYASAAVHFSTPDRRFKTLVRRARMHRDGVIFERIGSDPLHVPKADVEIDFDVEWHPNDGHVYQWGARVRSGSNEATATYAPTIVSFDPLNEQSAQALADRFFDWLEEFVTAHEDAGRSVAIYHWTSPETTRATRMLGGDRAQALFAGRFLDLKQFMEDRFFARDGFSLKVVAPAFGFEWDALDAGGNTSVTKIEQARAGVEPVASAAREWLLSYNEDDCAAQAWIRDGLHAHVDAGNIKG